MTDQNDKTDKATASISDSNPISKSADSNLQNDKKPSQILQETTELLESLNEIKKYWRKNDHNNVLHRLHSKNQNDLWEVLIERRDVKPYLNDFNGLSSKELDVIYKYIIESYSKSDTSLLTQDQSTLITSLIEKSDELITLALRLPTSPNINQAIDQLIKAQRSLRNNLGKAETLDIEMQLREIDIKFRQAMLSEVANRVEKQQAIRNWQTKKNYSYNHNNLHCIMYIGINNTSAPGRNVIILNSILNITCWIIW